MIQQRLERFLASRCCTLLGAGPMSKNCVDAVIELANDYEIPVLLVASRRQIEAETLGGGYVNGWHTAAFAQYVTDRDRKGKVILARDHGGPWQHDRDRVERVSLRRAMESAKRSYQTDIESGFEILHIDTSVDVHGIPKIEDILERAYELYEYCWTTAQRYQRDVVFEIGTEEQSGSTHTQEELEYVLHEMTRFCRKNHLPSPSFVVIQTGTRVMETRNVGSFDSPVRIVNELPAEIQVPKMIETCRRYHVFMKEHNTDYLSDDALAWHPKLGIHSANVAPEFGVAETRALLKTFEQHHLHDLADEFVNLAEKSRKWEKWMLPDTSATRLDRALIAGHYVFSDERCLDLKSRAQERLDAKGISLDFFLKEEVKGCIMRYLQHFRLVRIP
jgi:tagatose-1,6-bisphosphate aldolase non-catalytic subunit AgaZ/GatZ